MFDLGGGELLLIVLAVLVFFGPKKLPELAQSLGRGMREFKRAQREFTEQITQAVNDDSFKEKAKRETKNPAGTVARKGSGREQIDDDTHHDFVNELTEEEFRAEQARKIQMNGAAVADPLANSSASQSNAGSGTSDHDNTDTQTNRS